MQTLHEYQGFGVNLNEISQLIHLLENDKKYQLKESGFGDNKIRAIKDYLTDFSLADESKKISLLGEIIKVNDKKLIDDFSKWICLYNWSAKNNNPVLYYIVNFCSNGQQASTIIDSFKKWAIENDIQTDYKKNYVAGLLSKTINALTDADAFQNLTLFVESNGRVSRAEAYNVHPLLLAYILYDNSRGRHSISLPELVDEPGNIGKFFGYTIQTIENSLTALENLGVIKRVQHANLNMIELLYKGTPLAFVEQYYEEY